jgi:hypothetical protein
MRNIEKVMEHTEAWKEHGYERTEPKAFACARRIVLEDNIEHEHACSQSTEERCGV